MTKLHILQAGIRNKDKVWLERAARSRRNLKNDWIAPKSAQKGDEAVIYLGTAFFATARIISGSHPRPDWAPNRYGAAVDRIKLIEPPISLGLIRKYMPELAWANYPRSYATPLPDVAQKIRKLIASRRMKSGADVKANDLEYASRDELRAKALKEARAITEKKLRMTKYRIRSTAVHLYVLDRAEGICEGCMNSAPFKNLKFMPYLEPHHTTRLADDGADHPASVIALCPTCHSRVHHAHDGDDYNRKLKAKLRNIEPRLWLAAGGGRA
jgi:HNH endonuclease